MVPTVELATDRWMVRVGSELHEFEPDPATLARTLRRIAATHDTSGEVIMATAGDLPYSDLVAAVDAARSSFPRPVISGGIQ